MGYSVTNMVLPPLAKSPGASVTTVAAGQEKQTDHHHDSSTPLLPAIVDTRSGGQHVYRRLALAGTGEKPDRARISVWCSERGVFDFCLGMWLWHWANKNVGGGGGGGSGFWAFRLGNSCVGIGSNKRCVSALALGTGGGLKCTQKTAESTSAKTGTAWLGPTTLGSKPARQTRPPKLRGPLKVL